MRFEPGNQLRRGQPAWNRGKTYHLIPRVCPRDRLKCCTRCDEWFPIACFQRDKQNPDGRRNECRSCRGERREALRFGAERARPWGLKRASEARE